ncbi:unnamed protein product [Urochloa decumbens]|uniref:Uncharacterized protein n=1 Tax=Urochloa decumbens TaxID=240449 RepID=A0ABC9GBX4_9POAL
MGILEPDSEGAQELREQALEILTELAFDDSFKQLDFKRLLKALIRIFLEKEANNNNTAGDVAYGTKADVADRTIAELAQADREYKATRLRWRAGEALARLLSIRATTDVNFADKLSKQEAIDLLTKVLDQILTYKMGKTADAIKMIVIQKKNQVFEVLDQILSSKMGNFADVAIRAARETKNLVTEEHDQILSSKMGTNADAAKKALTKIENLPTEALGKILPSKMKTTVFIASHLHILIRGIEKQSEETKSMASMLSLAVAICNGGFVSREDFARATPADEMLAKKLKEILNANRHCTAECLKVVKLTCQVVVAIIRVKPSCIQRFNEHNLEGTLAEALETMSEVDDCMLFTAGNDRELVKPARSLASLVKEARELLETE